MGTLNVLKVDANTKVEIIELDEVGEILVDGVLGVSFTNNLPRLNFFAERTSHTDGSVRRVIVARLAMTPETANSVSEALRAILRKMVQEGLMQPLPSLNFE